MILCNVVVLAKTCFEKFSSGKNSRSPLSRKLLDVLKKNGLEINLMYIHIPPKFQFRYFDQFQRERLHESPMKLQDMIQSTTVHVKYFPSPSPRSVHMYLKKWQSKTNFKQPSMLNPVSHKRPSLAGTK